MRCVCPVLGISNRSSHSGLWARWRRFVVTPVQEALLSLLAALRLVALLCGPFHVFGHRSCGGLFVGSEPLSAILSCFHGPFELTSTRVRVRSPGLCVTIFLNVFALRTVFVESISL